MYNAPLLLHEYLQRNIELQLKFLSSQNIRVCGIALNSKANPGGKQGPKIVTALNVFHKQQVVIPLLNYATQGTMAAKHIRLKAIVSYFLF